MNEFSPISHLLAVSLLGWLYLKFTKVAETRGERVARNGIIGSLGMWIILSSLVAYHGLYQDLNERYLLLPIATLFPLTVVIVSYAFVPNVGRLLRSFIDKISLQELTFVHVMRIAAVGTIYHYLVGHLPGHFIIPVGFPDLLVGLTAYPLSRMGERDVQHRRRLLLAWNIVGAAVFLLAQPLIQLSQPGPFQMVTVGPNTNAVLMFPMSIVPTFIAPMLLGLHIVSIIKLQRARRNAFRQSVKVEGRLEPA